MILSPEVQRALGTARIDRGAKPVKMILTEVLDRKTYVKVNEAIEALGGKWSRKDKAHVFETDPAEAIDFAICSGELMTRKDFGFFPTPPELAARVVAKADIRSGMSVLEPSAGHGAIAAAARAYSQHVTCVDLDPKNVLHLRDMEFEAYLGDFLSFRPGEPFGSELYDRIVMNPPFGGSADVRHVLHAKKFLKPRGRLVSIMSAGVTFRKGSIYLELRDLIEESGEIEELPDGSFKESGTNCRTVLVTIDA